MNKAQFTVTILSILLLVSLIVNIYQLVKINELDNRIDNIISLQQEMENETIIIWNEYLSVPINQNVSNLSEAINIVTKKPIVIHETYINGKKINNTNELINEIAKWYQD